MADVEETLQRASVVRTSKKRPPPPKVPPPPPPPHAPCLSHNQLQAEPGKTDSKCDNIRDEKKNETDSASGTNLDSAKGISPLIAYPHINKINPMKRISFTTEDADIFPRRSQEYGSGRENQRGTRNSRDRRKNYADSRDHRRSLSVGRLDLSAFRAVQKTSQDETKKEVPARVSGNPKPSLPAKPKISPKPPISQKPVINNADKTLQPVKSGRTSASSSRHSTPCSTPEASPRLSRKEVIPSTSPVPPKRSARRLKPQPSSDSLHEKLQLQSNGSQKLNNPLTHSQDSCEESHSLNTQKSLIVPPKSSQEPQNQESGNLKKSPKPAVPNKPPKPALLAKPPSLQQKSSFEKKVPGQFSLDSKFVPMDTDKKELSRNPKLKCHSKSEDMAWVKKEKEDEGKKTEWNNRVDNSTPKFDVENDGGIYEDVVVDRNSSLTDSFDDRVSSSLTDSSEGTSSRLTHVYDNNLEGPQQYVDEGSGVTLRNKENKKTKSAGKKIFSFKEIRNEMNPLLPRRRKSKSSSEGSVFYSDSRSNSSDSWTGSAMFYRNISIGEGDIPDQEQDSEPIYEAISELSPGLPSNSKTNISPSIAEEPPTLPERTNSVKSFRKPSIKSNTMGTSGIGEHKPLYLRHSRSLDTKLGQTYGSTGKGFHPFDVLSLDNNDDHIYESIDFVRDSFGESAESKNDPNFEDPFEFSNSDSSFDGYDSGSDEEEAGEEVVTPVVAEESTATRELLEEQSTKDPLYKARQIATELLTTEEAYVKILYLIDQIFQFEVLKNKDQHMIPDDVIPQMFSNIKSLYQLHESFLLPPLKKRLAEWDSNPRIGDIMKKFSPFLKMYVEYVKNFKNAMSVISTWQTKSPKFAAIIKNIQAKEECGHITLQDHMLCPIQRVPRYQLLLTDYLKRLPEDSPDREDTQEALNLVTTAASHSNQAGKEIEGFPKLMEINESLGGAIDLISASRELKKEGKVNKISAKNGYHYERHLFLFNDLLLVCQQVPLALQVQYKIKNKMELDGMQVLEGDNIVTPDTFYVKSKRSTVEFYCLSHEEKIEWQATISNVVADYTRKQISRQINPDLTQFKDEGLGVRAPTWIKDQETSQCMQCGTSFKRIHRRRHHCRACGIVVCGKCSQRKAHLAYDDNKLGRVCDKCYVALEGNEPIPKLSILENKKKGILQVKASDSSIISSYLGMSLDGKSWQRRWFAVHGFALYSFKAHQDVNALTSMALVGYTVSAILKGNKTEVPKSFSLHHPHGMTYLFNADDGETANQWVSVLKCLVKAELPSDLKMQADSSNPKMEDNN